MDESNDSGATYVMGGRVGLVLLLLAGILMVAAVLPAGNDNAAPLVDLRSRYGRTETPSADHSRFAALKGPFAGPREVTAACISCHTDRHNEVMQSSHWNWSRTEYIPGKGLKQVGKANVLNNFCIGVGGNEESCAKCHVGYTYDGTGADLKDPLNVDCLACHDGSSTYVKANGKAGMPSPTVNLTLVAQKVGRPSRTTCGTCHFFGGGGNNVKHGDLEKALFNPNRDLDVHMATESSDMQCVDCHTANKHQMLGKVYSVSSMNRNRVECSTCHGNLPHKDDQINKHTDKVACQTCHIPTYAKDHPTKLRWDWSTAGKLKDGKPFEEKNADGVDTYMSIKGSFEWGKNLEPDYLFFNGTASHYLLGDKVDPSKPVQMNSLLGSYDDPDSKIIPVKIHRSKQIYDKGNGYLIQPKTYSGRPGDGGYWKEFDWNRAATEGMKKVGLPYSGEYGFIETEMYWPINHMVAPKEKTVQCIECHTRKDGRLAKLGGFYLPGRDRSLPVDNLGKWLLLATLVGVVVHGGGRIVSHRFHRGGRPNA